jgi:hypothetical protein
LFIKLLSILSQASEDAFCCFIPLVIFAVIAICAIYGSSQKTKKEASVKSLLDGMKSTYAKARLGEITKAEAELFFSRSDKVLSILSEDKSLKDSESIKVDIEKMSNQITMLLGLQSTGNRAVLLGEEIEKLANLRKQGVISDHEFQAFSERFKLSTGEKASGVIRAISELHEQHQKGAISEGNYHGALWSLLDKLDRKT